MYVCVFVCVCASIYVYCSRWSAVGDVFLCCNVSCLNLCTYVCVYVCDMCVCVCVCVCMYVHCLNGFRCF